MNKTVKPITFDEMDMMLSENLRKIFNGNMDRNIANAFSNMAGKYFTSIKTRKTLLDMKNNNRFKSILN